MFMVALEPLLTGFLVQLLFSCTPPPIVELGVDTGQIVKVTWGTFSL